MNLVAFFWLLLFVPPALWYLGSRAVITRVLWSRYPARLTRFMDCAACTSFWWGTLLYLLLAACDLTLGYPSYTAPLWGLTTLITGALVGYLHDQALYRLGEPEPQGAVDDPDCKISPVDDPALEVKPIGGIPRLALQNEGPMTSDEVKILVTGVFQRDVR